MPKKRNPWSKTPPKTVLDDETEFEGSSNLRWTHCPHDFTLKLLDLVIFAEGVLEEFEAQVHPSVLTRGERAILYQSLGLLHRRLVDIGIAHRPDPETVLLVD